ncbi:MAG: O-antigen ligase family protein [Terriglobia bacterium]
MRQDNTTLREKPLVLSGWPCILIATCLWIPPLYPASLGGQVPLYVGNFILAAWALSYLSKHRPIPLLSDEVTRLGSYFLGALALSLLFAWWFSGAHIASFAMLRFGLLCHPFLVYWLIRSSPGLSSEDWLRAFLISLLWIGAVVSLYGIVDFCWPIPYPHPSAEQFIYLKRQALRRAQGIFWESSSFGNLCAFFLTLTTGMFLSLRNRLTPSQQWVLLSFIGIFVSALFLSYSRGSWMAAFVTLAVFLVLSPRIRAVELLLVATAMVLPILILCWVSPDIVSNFFSYRVGTLGELPRNPNLATSGRWDSWSAILQYLTLHPWILGLGIGYKTLPYTTLFGRKIIADNGYLSLLIEGGLIGLGLFLLLNAALLKSFYKARQTGGPLRKFAGTFMLSFWCGEIVQLSTGDIFTFWRNLVVFFALAAAIQNIEK